MDLSQFDTRQKAEAGVEIPLVIEGETIYGDDDKPVTFLIKGLADEEVHGLVLKATGTQKRTPQEVRQSDMKLARTVVVGWSNNFTVDGKKYEFSRANIEKVLDNPVVRQAVLSGVFDQHRFMKGS